MKHRRMVRRKVALRLTGSGLGGGEENWKSWWLGKGAEPDWVSRSGEEAGQRVVQIRCNYPS